MNKKLKDEIALLKRQLKDAQATNSEHHVRFEDYRDQIDYWQGVAECYKDGEEDFPTLPKLMDNDNWWFGEYRLFDQIENVEFKNELPNT